MTLKQCFSITLLVALTKAGNPYPEVDDFEYVNYADPNQGHAYVQYDYIDHQDQYRGSYYQENSDHHDNRYNIDEKAQN